MQLPSVKREKIYASDKKELEKYDKSKNLYKQLYT